jgi:hypothetical protein
MNLKLDTLKCMELTCTGSSCAHVASVWGRESLSIAEAAAQKGLRASSGIAGRLIDIEMIKSCRFQFA